MKKYLIGCLILLCNLYLSTYAGQKSLEGDWIGTLNIGEKPEAIDVYFAAEKGSINGTLDLPFRELTNLTLSKIKAENAAVHFEWQLKSETFVFDGKLTHDVISGNVRQGNSIGTLQLVRTVKADQQAFQQIAGLYEFAPDKLVFIALHPRGPVYADYQTGQTGFLFPQSEDIFFAGSSLSLPTPVETKVNFIRDKQNVVTGLTWQKVGGKATRARKINFRREEVTFQNGDVTLSGTLVLPNTKAPYPVSLKIGGAGASTRRNLTDEFYAYHGIAYLGYDKRGAGKSTGDWKTVGVEELAADALAAVRYLKSRKDIDPKQIGIEGSSEGGWIAPLVASKAEDIAYIVLYAGPALSYADELENETEDRLRRAGISGEELTAGVKFRRSIQDMIQSGEALTDEGWAKIQMLAQKSQNEKWFRYVRPPQNKGWQQNKFSLMLQFDPHPIWEKTTIPVLALYGGKDQNVPAEKNVTALESALKKSGNKDYRIIVFPKANHEGLEAETGDEEEIPYLKKYVNNYFNTPIDWILKRVKISRK